MSTPTLCNFFKYLQVITLNEHALVKNVQEFRSKDGISTCKMSLQQPIPEEYIFWDYNNEMYVKSLSDCLSSY